MEVIRMKGHNVYWYYTVECTYSSVEYLLRFTNVNEFILHAEKITLQIGNTEYKEDHKKDLSEQKYNQEN